MYRRVGTDPVTCQVGKVLARYKVQSLAVCRGKEAGAILLALALPLVSSWAGRNSPPRNPVAWHAQTTSLAGRSPPAVRPAMGGCYHVLLS